MQWLSPAFPVGAFAYSHGMEWAVHSGKVFDKASARAWIAGVLAHGAGRNDAILLVQAYLAPDKKQLARVGELGSAFVSSKERHIETHEMGRAFVRTYNKVWDAHIKEMAYPIVIGVAAKEQGIDLKLAVSFYLHSFAANLVAVCQRLVPLGQIEAQETVAKLIETIENLLPEILDCGPDDLGGASVLGDMASMAHETQTTRLFKT